MKPIKYLLFHLCICGIISCTTTTRHIEHDTSIVDIKIKQGKPLPPKEWHVYNVEEEKICIPETWGYVNQNSFFFVSDISKLSPGSYFGVIKRKIEPANLTMTNYLKDLYSALKKDTTGKLQRYTVLKMTYQDKNVYTCEFHTTIGNEPYVNYSTIFEKNGSIFDLALRIQESKSKPFLKTYQNIVYNFYSKGQLVFSVNDKVTGVEEVNIETL